MIKTIKYIDIQSQNRHAPFISFKNSDDKHWLIPTKDMKTGLEIYEPSGLKGKILKKMLCVFSRSGMADKFGTFKFCDVRLLGELKKLLDAVYQEYEFSIFGGTPSVDQKITIQIFRKKQILGYCKLGTSNRVRNLFIHEMRILKILENSNMDHVPRCKGVFDLDQETSAFIQTTEKRTGTRVEHEFGTKHKDFLNILFEKTKEDILFEDTDFYRSLVYLKENVHFLETEYQHTVVQALDSALSRYKGRHVIWGLCHRDFTPWNTCITNNQLFVFDFEYALQYAPPEIDRWHFFVQTLWYEKKRSADEIAREFLQKFPDEKNSFELYLLDNISLYLLRGNVEDKKIANYKARILKQVHIMC